jgi:NitT/TauT family transport system substrate-binding protein
MSTKWPRIIAALLIVAATSASFMPARAQQAQPPKIVDILGPDGFFYLLHYITAEAGFFKEEGVDVEQVTVSSGSRQIAIVMGGSADSAEVNLSVSLQGYVKGGDLVNIGTAYAIFAHSVFLGNDAVKKTGITDGMPLEEKVKRLRGLKIGISSPGSGTDQLIRTLFVGRGMDTDKEVTIMPVGGGPPMIAALKQGAIDGFIFTAPLPQIAAAEGLGKVVISPFDGEVPELRDMTYISLVTSQDALKKKRPQLLAFVRAMTKGLKLARDNPQEARRLTRKRFADMDEKVYNSSFDEYLKGLPASLVITPAQLKRTLAFMNLLDKKEHITVNYADVIYPDLARQAADEILGR